MDGMINSGQYDDRSSRNESLQTSERFKMLEITRDKPIKVAVKVAVPVRDHPKFNFVGKLLGPKGNSMKRLQEDTMCKMAILGRGSMRDRKKEDELRASGEPRYAHLGEDLHVEISTFAPPAEAHARIAYALAEVRRFLVPDYHDDIRQEQMWEMQAITSSSQTQTGEQNSPNSLTDLESTNMDCSNDGEIKTINESGGLNVIGSLETTITTATSTNNITTSEQQQQQIDNTTINTGLNTNNNITIPSAAVAAAIQQQLGLGMLKPSTGVAPITGQTQTQLALGIPSEVETTATTLQMLEPRGLKTVNLAAGSLARKRPLLGVPRSSMNPTKRTVMTLLARAKNSQEIHPLRGVPPLHDPLQMLTASPLLMSHHHLHHHPGMDATSMAAVVAAQKESLTQGV